MANQCATLAEFLAQVPEFVTTGPQSAGTITVTVQPTAGDTISITNPFGLFPVIETLEAGAEFAIGADEAETATNIATALAASALVTAAAVGEAVQLTSIATGSYSLLGLTSSNPAALTLSASTLEGGDVQVTFALGCACAQINLGCWGVKADCGHIYLTAHYLTVLSGGESGPIKRKKIDKIEIEYAATGTTGLDADFGSTKWGRMYLALKKSLVVLPVPGRSVLPFVF